MENAQALYVKSSHRPGLPRDGHRPIAARPRLGGISFLHRFGSALNHHVHLHACVTDGVFVPAAASSIWLLNPLARNSSSTAWLRPWLSPCSRFSFLTDISETDWNRGLARFFPAPSPDTLSKESPLGGWDPSS
jgi:hypothetical protein